MILTRAGSTVELLARLTSDERAAWLASLSPAEAEAFLDDWRLWARENQQIPGGNWQIWLILAGRGYGKTRTGAEFIKERWRGGFNRMALIGPTGSDVRDVMVDGESGILNLHWRPDERPVWAKTRRRLEWPNGAVAEMYSAEEPDRLRGPQHDAFWGDELGSWRYPDTYDQLMFGLRLGNWPHGVFTTTPKPTAVVLDLVKRAIPVAEIQSGVEHDVVLTTGSTYENQANLAPRFFRNVTRKYEGTRLGRQELMAELLTDTPGALWTMKLLEEGRIRREDLSRLRRIVVGVDPGGKSGEDAEEKGLETGIVIAGIDARQHVYILGDVSGTLSPNGWAKRAIGAYELHEADRIVAEKNYGGEMVQSTIQTVDSSVPVTVVTASRGKEVRAEPVSALSEQGRLHMVGSFGPLESELTTWVPGVTKKSPNRLDAMVWAVTDLLKTRGGGVPRLSSSGPAGSIYQV